MTASSAHVGGIPAAGHGARFGSASVGPIVERDGRTEARIGNRLVTLAPEQNLLPSEDRSADAIEITVRINLMASGDRVGGHRPRQISGCIRVAFSPGPGDYLAVSGGDTVVFVEITDVAGSPQDPDGVQVTGAAARRDAGPLLAATGWQPSPSSYPDQAVARKLLTESRTGDITTITVSGPFDVDTGTGLPAV